MMREGRCVGGRGLEMMAACSEELELWAKSMGKIGV